MDASTPGVYRRESSVWDAKDDTLEEAPSRYREEAGGLCVEGDAGSPSDGEETALPSMGGGINHAPTSALRL